MARKSGIFRGILTGTTMGLMFGTIYGCYGLGLWYGVKIIKDEEETDEFKWCRGNCTSDALEESWSIGEAQVSDHSSLSYDVCQIFGFVYPPDP